MQILTSVLGACSVVGFHNISQAFYVMFQVMLYVDMEVNGVPLKVSYLSQQMHYSSNSLFYVQSLDRSRHYISISCPAFIYYFSEQLDMDFRFVSGIC